MPKPQKRKPPMPAPKIRAKRAVDGEATIVSFARMSVQEIQSQLAKLSPQEQADVARFLEAIRQTHTTEFAHELAEAHREMDAGRKVSEAELTRLLAARPATPRL